MDLQRAFDEVRLLPDSVLQQELASPSGYVPGWMVLGEVAERKMIRSQGAGQKPNPKTIAEQMGAPVQGYAQGGAVRPLDVYEMYLNESARAGGLPSLPAPQNLDFLGEPQTPNSLQPLTQARGLGPQGLESLLGMG